MPTGRPSQSICLALALLTFFALPARPATPQQVESAIKKGVDSLYKRQKNGNWENAPAPAKEGKEWEVTGKQWGGLTAIATYALLASGQSPSDDRLKPAIEFLLKSDIDGTYAIAMRTQAWTFLPQSPEVKRMVARDARTLKASVKDSKEARGLFSYWNDPRAARYDHSCSNYGVLGLWACADLDVEMPRDLWEMMEDGWRKHQNDDGGWSYIYKAKDKSGQSTLSMTTAALATLFITKDFVRSMEGIGCTPPAPDEHMERGMKFLIANYEKFKEQHPYYTLYNIERIGVASGYKYFGTINWYEHGAEHLVKTQRGDGSWGSVQDTAWALLFLNRGRAPVVLNKLDYTADGAKKPAPWNNRPRDAANLSRWIGKQIERDLNWQIVNLKAPVEELHDAPILYITGSEPVPLTVAEKNKLREFVEQGGLILGHADCGRKPFADWFQQLGAELFPAHAWRDLPESHPIYTAEQYVRDNWKTPPPLVGLSNGARELMLLFPTGDPAKSWQIGAFVGADRSPQAQLAANIFLYAVDKKNLRYKGEQFLVAKDDKKKPTKTIKLARLEYAGNWNPEPGGWRRMSVLMHNQFGVTLDAQPVKLGAGKLDKSFHAAHLTGAGAITFDDAARAELKKYVEAGGTLLIDAAGGSSEFAVAVENELRQTFAGASLAVLKPDHSIYSNGTPITEVAYRAFAKKVVGNIKQPRLRALDVKNRTAVVYSSEDLSVGLVGQPLDGITGYEPKSAADLMANLLLYAASIKVAPPAPVASTAGATKTAAPLPANLASRKAIDLSKAIDNFASGWTVANCGPEGNYKEEWFGKQGVLTTHPLNPNTPCVLTKSLPVPARRTTTLHLTVGHHEQGDWDLIVKVDGKEVKKQPVNKSTAKSGWLALPIDLTPFAGKVAKVELLNQPTGWSNEHAYWNEIRVEVK